VIVLRQHRRARQHLLDFPSARVSPGSAVRRCLDEDDRRGALFADAARCFRCPSMLPASRISSGSDSGRSRSVACSRLPPVARQGRGRTTFEIFAPRASDSRCHATINSSSTIRNAGGPWLVVTPLCPMVIGCGATDMTRPCAFRLRQHTRHSAALTPSPIIASIKGGDVAGPERGRTALSRRECFFRDQAHPAWRIGGRGGGIPLRTNHVVFALYDDVPAFAPPPRTRPSGQRPTASF